MILFLVAIFLLIVFSLKRRTDNNYMSYTQTENIKGVFAIIIFFSHIKQYLELKSALDLLYVHTLESIGQLMVVIFFFYSGYGIMYGYNNKEKYDRGFLKKRIIKTWFHFFIAVMFFFVFNIILGIKYSTKIILFSFIGWESIGNSNWFVFDILLLYLFVCVGFLINKIIGLKNKNKVLIVCVFIATVLAIFILRKVKPSWWYDTLLGFPVGMGYYLIKERFDYILKKRFLYMVAGVFLFIAFVFTYILKNVIAYNICAGCFCIILCWCLFNVEMNNRIFAWLGNNSFYIYIYMRLPMIIFSCFGLNKAIYLYTIIVLICTIFLATFMKKIQIQLDSYINGKYISRRSVFIK